MWGWCWRFAHAVSFLLACFFVFAPLLMQCPPEVWHGSATVVRTLFLRTTGTALSPNEEAWLHYATHRTAACVSAALYAEYSLSRRLVTPPVALAMQLIVAPNALNAAGLPPSASATDRAVLLREVGAAIHAGIVADQVVDPPQLPHTPSASTSAGAGAGANADTDTDPDTNNRAHGRTPVPAASWAWPDTLWPFPDNKSLPVSATPSGSTSSGGLLDWLPFGWGDRPEDGTARPQHLFDRAHQRQFNPHMFLSGAAVPGPADVFMFGALVPLFHAVDFDGRRLLELLGSDLVVQWVFVMRQLMEDRAGLVQLLSHTRIPPDTVTQQQQQ